MVRLSDIQGLWRRRLIGWPGGEMDTTTEVYWLQGPHLYTDLRIPEGRPACTASCLRELDWPILKFLARLEGFFGHLDVEDSVGHWHRAFDYQPPTEHADRGRLTFEGAVLSEHGIESPYLEHWVREAGSEDVFALSLKTEDRIGCFVAAGTAFMFAKSRSKPLPAGADLTECVAGAASLAEAQDLFDCEISFGRVRDSEWRIERSSLPFREGHELHPDFENKTGTLSVDDLTLDGLPERRAWHIAALEGTSARSLTRWLEPTSTAEAVTGLRDSNHTTSG
jgi:hypothetical protein